MKEQTKKIIYLLSLDRTLTANEEKEIFTYYNKNKTEEIRNLIFLKNRKLIYKISSKYKEYGNGIEKEDIEQEGTFGLLRAIDTFDCSRNTKFSTHACLWIKQSITRYLANAENTVRLPAYITTDYYKITRISDEYNDKHGHAPSIGYISQQMGKKEKYISNIISAYKKRASISLEKPVKKLKTDDILLIDTLEVSGNQYDNFAKAEDIDRLMRKIKELVTEREYNILLLRYGFKDGEFHTYADIAEKEKCSFQNIRKIEESALNKIRNSTFGKNLETYRAYLQNA